MSLLANSEVPEYRLSVGSGRVFPAVKMERVGPTPRTKIFLFAVLTVNVCSNGARDDLPVTARKVKALKRPGAAGDGLVEEAVVPLVIFE